MSNLVPANFGQVSSRFAQTPVQDDLSSGIQTSFGLIGYKGKVWSIRYRGDEQQLMRDDGDGPRGSVEVVILKASGQISKIWYEHGYVEGSNSAPDCFSNNGVVPDPTSSKKQCDTCALCPHNQWGSRITPAGKQGKACSDSKRLAVVPAQDIENSAYGGPMLLRVPAASLQDVASYGQKMQQLGYPYYAVSTRIAFDPEESYPKFLFNAVRPLNDAEADLVLAMRDQHSVDRILSESEFATPTPAPAAPDLASAFEQPPQTAPKTEAKVDPAPTQTGPTPEQQAAIDKAAADKAAADKAAADKAAADKAAADKAAEQQAAEQAAQQAAAKAAEQPVTSEGNTTKPSGFGATAPVKAAEDKPAEQQAAANTAPAGSSSFEADLDSMLDELL